MLLYLSARYYPNCKEGIACYFMHPGWVRPPADGITQSHSATSSANVNNSRSQLDQNAGQSSARPRIMQDGPPVADFSLPTVHARAAPTVSPETTSQAGSSTVSLDLPTTINRSREPAASSMTIRAPSPPNISLDLPLNPATSNIPNKSTTALQPRFEVFYNTTGEALKGAHDLPFFARVNLARGFPIEDDGIVMRLESELQKEIGGRVSGAVPGKGCVRVYRESKALEVRAGRNELKEYLLAKVTAVCKRLVAETKQPPNAPSSYTSSTAYPRPPASTASSHTSASTRRSKPEIRGTWMFDPDVFHAIDTRGMGPRWMEKMRGIENRTFSECRLDKANNAIDIIASTQDDLEGARAEFDNLQMSLKHFLAQNRVPQAPNLTSTSTASTATVKPPRPPIAGESDEDEEDSHPTPASTYRTRNGPQPPARNDVAVVPIIIDGKIRGYDARKTRDVVDLGEGKQNDTKSTTSASSIAPVASSSTVVPPTTSVKTTPTDTVVPIIIDGKIRGYDGLTNRHIILGRARNGSTASGSDVGTPARPGTEKPTPQDGKCSVTMSQPSRSARSPTPSSSSMVSSSTASQAVLLQDTWAFDRDIFYAIGEMKLDRKWFAKMRGIEIETGTKCRVMSVNQVVEIKGSVQAGIDLAKKRFDEIQESLKCYFAKQPDFPPSSSPTKTTVSQSQQPQPDRTPLHPAPSPPGSLPPTTTTRLPPTDTKPSPDVPSISLELPIAIGTAKTPVVQPETDHGTNRESKVPSISLALPLDLQAPNVSLPQSSTSQNGKSEVPNISLALPLDLRAPNVALSSSSPARMEISDAKPKESLDSEKMPLPPGIANEDSVDAPQVSLILPLDVPVATKSATNETVDSEGLRVSLDLPLGVGLAVTAIPVAAELEVNVGSSQVPRKEFPSETGAQQVVDKVSQPDSSAEVVTASPSEPQMTIEATKASAASAETEHMDAEGALQTEIDLGLPGRVSVSSENRGTSEAPIVEEADANKPPHDHDIDVGVPKTLLGLPLGPQKTEQLQIVSRGEIEYEFVVTQTDTEQHLLLDLGRVETAATVDADVVGSPEQRVVTDLETRQETSLDLFSETEVKQISIETPLESETMVFDAQIGGDSKVSNAAVDLPSSPKIEMAEVVESSLSVSLNSGIDANPLVAARETVDESAPAVTTVLTPADPRQSNVSPDEIAKKSVAVDVVDSSAAKKEIMAGDERPNLVADTVSPTALRLTESGMLAVLGTARTAADASRIFFSSGTVVDAVREEVVDASVSGMMVVEKEKKADANGLTSAGPAEDMPSEASPATRADAPNAEIVSEEPKVSTNVPLSLEMASYPIVADTEDSSAPIEIPSLAITDTSDGQSLTTSRPAVDGPTEAASALFMASSSIMSEQRAQVDGDGQAIKAVVSAPKKEENGEDTFDDHEGEDGVLSPVEDRGRTSTPDIRSTAPMQIQSPIGPFLPRSRCSSSCSSVYEDALSSFYTSPEKSENSSRASPTGSITTPSRSKGTMMGELRSSSPTSTAKRQLQHEPSGSVGYKLSDEKEEMPISSLGTAMLFFKDADVASSDENTVHVDQSTGYGNIAGCFYFSPEVAERMRVDDGILSKLVGWVEEVYGGVVKRMDAKGQLVKNTTGAPKRRRLGVDANVKVVISEKHQGVLFSCLTRAAANQFLENLHDYLDGEFE
ncbi:hypothetical protein HK102_013107 [Quaeritorhiza haematococci]|nr:hypothetical protein HK102_013107 [Quaeritorhiza haematococci]